MLVCVNLFTKESISKYIHSNASQPFIMTLYIIFIVTLYKVTQLFINLLCLSKTGCMDDIDINITLKTLIHSSMLLKSLVVIDTFHLSSSRL